MQEVIRRALATGKGMRPGPEPRWIVLSGWMSDVWDPPVFRKELLDAAAPDPEGGRIKRDQNGEPTGEFVERAPPQLTRLIPPLPPLTDYERSRNLVEGTPLAVASGLTTIHGAGMTDYDEVQRRLKLYGVGLLPIRINEMVHPSAARRLGKPLNYQDRTSRRLWPPGSSPWASTSGSTA